MSARDEILRDLLAPKFIGAHRGPIGAEGLLDRYRAEVRAETLRAVADLWMERSTTATVPRERMDLRHRAHELREMADDAERGDDRG